MFSSKDAGKHEAKIWRKCTFLKKKLQENQS